MSWNISGSPWRFSRSIPARYVSCRFGVNLISSYQTKPYSHLAYIVLHKSFRRLVVTTHFVPSWRSMDLSFHGQCLKLLAYSCDVVVGPSSNFHTIQHRKHSRNAEVDLVYHHLDHMLHNLSRPVLRREYHCLRQRYLCAKVSRSLNH